MIKEGSRDIRGSKIVGNREGTLVLSLADNLDRWKVQFQMTAPAAGGGDRVFLRHNVEAARFLALAALVLGGRFPASGYTEYKRGPDHEGNPVSSMLSIAYDASKRNQYAVEIVWRPGRVTATGAVLPIKDAAPLARGYITASELDMMTLFAAGDSHIRGRDREVG